MVNIKVARKPSKSTCQDAGKGEKCKNLYQIQSKSTKMRAMRC